MGGFENDERVTRGCIQTVHTLEMILSENLSFQNTDTNKRISFGTNPLST